ncbi:MAG: NAD(P)-binding protein [Streptosporangiales bacterium]|nr:NAD(P)-binding protein [Streptosporangiales bacterium]
MTGETTLNPAVAVVGAGPGGLTAARELAASRSGQVLVLERNGQPGGAPHYSHQLGYGLRDLGRLLSGPGYARQLAAAAHRAGAAIRTDATVTGWVGERTLQVTTPQGLLHVQAQAVVLATGARERPRPARLVPGTRPAGVYTTGQLQRLVHAYRRFVGRHAVVVGADPVSWSAVLTLREAGAHTVLMTTEQQHLPAYSVAGRVLLRTPVAPGTRVVRILGERTVEGVEVEDAAGGRRIVDCDCVVFTGDWVPEHELARSARLELAAGSRSPSVDGALRTSRPGVFGAGDLLHPVATAGFAALDGRHVARSVLAWLDGNAGPRESVRLVAEAPLRWVTPTAVRPGDPPPPRGQLLAWTDEFRARPTVVVRQGDAELTSRRLPRPAWPGRAVRVPAALLRAADPTAGEVRISLR